MRRTRAFWLAGILLMHLSIGLTMGLYLFGLIMIVLNLAAFGPEYLAKLDRTRFRRWSRRASAPIWRRTESFPEPSVRGKVGRPIRSCGSA